MPHEVFGITLSDGKSEPFDGLCDTEWIARNHATADYSNVDQPHKFIRMLQYDLCDILKLLGDEREKVQRLEGKDGRFPSPGVDLVPEGGW